MRSALLLAASIAGVAFAAEVPRQSLEYTIQLPDGTNKLLSQYRGKVVCLAFVFTTCPHCGEASKLLSRLQTEYGPRGFQPLGSAFNDMSRMLLPDFVRDNRITFPVGYASREAVHTYLQHNPMMRLSVPQIVFVDRKGKVRYQSEPWMDDKAATEANLRKWIETLLKEPAGGPAPAPPSSAAARKKS